MRDSHLVALLLPYTSYIVKIGRARILNRVAFEWAVEGQVEFGAWWLIPVIMVGGDLGY